MFDEESFSLAPINFFQISCDCYYLNASSKDTYPSLTKKRKDKYQLPSTSALCAERPFATLSIGWSEEGIEILATVKQAVQGCFYPDVHRGDSLEIMIDTRDVKTSGFNTRFCHHFFFLPEAVEGYQKGEITRFRTEDMHELCDPNDLKLKVEHSSDEYTMKIFLPSQCLNGYDPEQFDRMGFTYRVNRLHGSPQHFSVVSDDFQVEQQPSLWGSLRLVK